MLANNLLVDNDTLDKLAFAKDYNDDNRNRLSNTNEEFYSYSNLNNKKLNSIVFSS